MKLIFQSLVIFAGVLFSLDLLAQLLGEVLWFEALGYFSVLLTRLQTQGLMWLTVVGVSLLACWGNLSLAERLKHTSKPLDPLSLQPTLDQKLQPQFFTPEGLTGPDSQKQSRAISLGTVLFIGSSLGSFLGILILYYSRLIQERWQPDWTVPNISPQSIERLNPLELLGTLLPITDYPLHWGGANSTTHPTLMVSSNPTTRLSHQFKSGPGDNFALPLGPNPTGLSSGFLSTSRSPL